MRDKAIHGWTSRLVTIAPDIDESVARDFVQDVYEAACRDLDEERSEADYEREE